MLVSIFESVVISYQPPLVLYLLHYFLCYGGFYTLGFESFHSTIEPILISLSIETAPCTVLPIISLGQEKKIVTIKDIGNLYFENHLVIHHCNILTLQSALRSNLLRLGIKFPVIKIIDYTTEWVTKSYQINLRIISLTWF